MVVEEGLEPPTGWCSVFLRYGEVPLPTWLHRYIMVDLLGIEPRTNRL